MMNLCNRIKISWLYHHRQKIFHYASTNYHFWSDWINEKIEIIGGKNGDTSSQAMICYWNQTNRNHKTNGKFIDSNPPNFLLK